MMYISCDVWNRLVDGRIARYRCFRTLPGDRYCVQSKDIYDPRHFANIAVQHARQFLELLAEEAPDLRGDTFHTLQDAIAHHDSEFSEE